MIIASPSKRKYSPPRTNLSKMLAHVRAEKQQKNVPKNYQLPSIEDFSPSKQNQSVSQAPKQISDVNFESDEVKIVERPLQMFNSNEKIEIFNDGNTMQSHVPTPRLGFSIKKKYNPVKKQFTFEQLREQKPYRSPTTIYTQKPKFYNKPTFQVKLNENLETPKTELDANSQMIYPDGHMSPVDGCRQAHVYI